MNIVLLIGALILVTLALMKFAPLLFKDGGVKNKSRPLAGSKPGKEIPNDKLVVVSKIAYDDVKNAITGFCNMYNERNRAALPRLIKLTDDQFAITFPYDIEFEIFCYFVNYMAFPEGLDISPEVIAWTTTNPNDNWIKASSANKKAMIFLPENDTWSDFVLMTTEDNIGYKLGFAINEQKQLLSLPEKSFVAPKVNVPQLSLMAGEYLC